MNNDGRRQRRIPPQEQDLFDESIPGGQRISSRRSRMNDEARADVSARRRSYASHVDEHSNRSQSDCATRQLNRDERGYVHRSDQNSQETIRLNRNQNSARRNAYMPEDHSQKSSHSNRRGQNGSEGASCEAYSRNAAHGEYSERASKQSKRRKIIIAAVIAAAIVVSVGALAWGYMSKISHNMNDGLDDSLGGALESPVAGEPFYILLMGVDKSAERADSEEYAGDTFRSDSMILARVDPQQKTITLISLHRDTLIDMGEYGEQKLNAAHQIGGPAYAVEVVSDFAGVPIHHYAEIDFDGFKAVVDALGGVEVDVPMEIDDPMAGGHLDAGVQVLNGDQALILARARHAYDDYGDGDVYRAANQRLILGAVANAVLSSDLLTIEKIVRSASEYITTDMDLVDIIAVAQSLRGIDASKDIYSIMEPTEAIQINGGWYEYVNEEAWRAIMTRVDQGLPPVENEKAYANEGGVTDGSLSKDYIAESALSGSKGDKGTKNAPNKSFVIVVRNGNGQAGSAAEAAEELEGKGYAVDDVGNADSSDFSSTIVVYNDDNRKDDARSIAEALHVGHAVKNNGEYLFDGDFLVVVGQDY